MLTSPCNSLYAACATCKAGVPMCAQQQQCRLRWELNQGLTCLATDTYLSAKLLLKLMSVWEVLLLLQMVLSGCQAGQRQSPAHLTLLQEDTVLCRLAPACIYTSHNVPAGHALPSTHLH